ncbi:hypothetical protein [Methylobacterium sp. A54F]
MHVDAQVKAVRAKVSVAQAVTLTVHGHPSSREQQPIRWLEWLDQRQIQISDEEQAERRPKY